MRSTPLAVDLDGCLISTDLLYESLSRAVFSNPFIVFLIPFWLFRGKSYLKQQLARLAEINVDTLPYNSALLEYLKNEHANGREIILCTGAWGGFARQISEKFNFFSSFYATTEGVNLTGENKARLLRKLYGDGNFSYAGNEKKDLKIWKHARSAIVVSKKEALVKEVQKLCKVEKGFVTKKTSFQVVFKTIRLHQWVKNALIFTPLATAHQLTNIPLVIDSGLAFFSFSLCASATYIINDLADLESDRVHPTKCQRPLASGAITIKYGVLLSVFLLCLSFAICFLLPIWFLLCLCLYLIITVSYSFKLKSLQTIDITTLASLYTLRIFAGGAATSIQPSFWLLAFSMFVFFCLAIVKRVSELHRSRLKYAENEKISGRGYYTSDMQVLLSLGTSSGMLSILVFAMYINSEDVTKLYREPLLLWFVCPIFGYWIVRILIMASRGEIDEDPIVFAINDWRSWTVAGVILMVILEATVLK